MPRRMLRSRAGASMEPSARGGSRSSTSTRARTTSSWQASARAPGGSLDPYPGAVAAADSNGKLRGRIRLLSSSVL